MLIRNSNVVDKFKLELRPNSYSSVDFGLFNKFFIFDKILAKHPHFIDWTDQSEIDELLSLQIQESLEFICRPWNDDLEQNRNLNNRKVCCLLFNASNEKISSFVSKVH